MIKANEDIILDKIIKLARLQYHKPYVHGKMGPDAFDCAGLIFYLYNEILGINIFEGGYGLSTTTMSMTSIYGKLTLYKEEQAFKDISLIKKGDILFFHRQSLDNHEPLNNNKYPGHCGIYLGNLKFLHASRSNHRIIINSFFNEYWKKVLVGSKSIIVKNKIYINKK